MTLLEVLLTLTLLVVLASLTWPALTRPMATQRLRESADQVRTEWVRARVAAMSSGAAHVFRYTPDGDGYSIETYAGEDELASDTMAADLGSVDEAVSRSQHRRLVDKVKFAADSTAAQPVAAGGPSSGVGLPSAGDSGLSQPIFFYADGTSADAQVWLENEYGERIGLSLRGLTGVVTVSRVQSAEARGQ